MRNVALVGRDYMLARSLASPSCSCRRNSLFFGDYVDRIILGCALVVTLTFLPSSLVGAAKAVIGWYGHRPAAIPIENRT